MLAGIVGGEKVQLNSPDVEKAVMLLVKGNVTDENGKTKSTTWLCAASIISPHVLLTAAHCIGDDIGVIFHPGISCESGFKAETDVRKATRGIKNPDYKESEKGTTNLSNDIAIVILPDPVPARYEIFKIADPKEYSNTTEDVLFLGYGKIGTEKYGSGILRKVKIPVVQVIASESEGIVKIDQSKGKGLCSGDSGGASLVQINNEMQILGVNSAVIAKKEEMMCEERAVQALAFKHKAWINSKLKLIGEKLID